MSAPPIMDATISTLVELIERQSKTIEALVGLVAQRQSPPAAEHPRWDDPEAIADAKAKIVEWLHSHPDAHPSKSEIARRLFRLSNATVWSAIQVLEAEGVITIERTKHAHRLSLCGDERWPG